MVTFVNYFTDILTDKISSCECGVDLLIIVKSAISHHKHRTAIRNAWSDSSSVSVNFVVGTPSDAVDTVNFQEVLQEKKQYKDMIIGKFSDTYSNLTKKSLSAFKWATESCRNYGYLALVDDDIKLDVERITKEIQNREKPRAVQTKLSDLDYVHCLHVIQNRARAMRRGKWAVSKAEYPLDFYPKICSGAGMLLPNRAVSIIYNMAKETTSFPIDDVFISGILRVKSGLAIRGPGVFSRTVQVITDEDVATNI